MRVLAVIRSRSKPVFVQWSSSVSFLLWWLGKREELWHQPAFVHNPSIKLKRPICLFIPNPIPFPAASLEKASNSKVWKDRKMYIYSTHLHDVKHAVYFPRMPPVALHYTHGILLYRPTSVLDGWWWSKWKEKHTDMCSWEGLFKSEREVKAFGSNAAAIFSSASSICGSLGQQLPLDTGPSVRDEPSDDAQSRLSCTSHHSQAENSENCVKEEGASQTLVLNCGRGGRDEE